MMHSFDITEEIKDIDVPVLLLYGEHDIFFPVEDGVLIMEMIGDNAQMTILPNQQHHPHKDAPELVMKHITLFIEEIENKREKIFNDKL